MKSNTIFDNYTPLANYFKVADFKNIQKSENAFFEALKVFKVDEALKYLKQSKPENIADDAEKVLADLKLNMSGISAYQQFVKVEDEAIDKNNYLHKYPLTDLLPGSPMDYMKMISVSSGTSGKPYFWPRGNYLELETTLVYELILKDFFQIDKKKTLVIDAYSMGMYVAGTFTLNACLRLAERSYDLSVITPGISVDSILRIISEIGHLYDQVILCGYPPFVKDTVEEGISRGIDWADYNMKFIFGAEAISENWRDYLYKKAQVKDYYQSSINTYGSADAGILGHETPLSILIKKLAGKNPNLLNKLFGGREVSTFVQYHPSFKYFQSKDGELYCSTVGGMPLVDYRLHDAGEVYSFEEVVKLLKAEGIDIIKEAKSLDLPVWKLPFIVLYGKSDQTVTIYGLNVYPQTVRSALEDKLLIDQLTTRMCMQTKYSEEQDQFLEIELELGKEVLASEKLEKLATQTIYEYLLKHNYEYKTLVEKIGQPRATPRVILKNHGSISADRGSKQKWIK